MSSRCVPPASRHRVVASCAPALVVHRVEDRSIQLAQTVRFVNLPQGTRIVLEAKAPEVRQVLAANVTGSAQIPFSYPVREHVDNGSVNREVQTKQLTISVEARGHLPRIVMLSVPGPEQIDASLQRPTLRALATTTSPDLDVILDRVLSGSCDEAKATELRAGATVTAPQAELITQLTAECKPNSYDAEPEKARWEPEQSGVPGTLASSPAAAIAALQALMQEEHDAVGARGLAQITSDVSSGKLSTAANVAELVAAPLPAKRAALVLQLPTALLAAARMRQALAALTDPQAAMQLAAEARHIDPLVGRQSFARVLRARIAALQSRAARLESTDPVLARAYYAVVEALRPRDRTALEALARTRAATLGLAHAALAVEVSGDPDLAEKFRTRLAAALPPHVTLAASSAASDGSLQVEIGAIQRLHQVRRADRSTMVKVGTVAQRNPDFDLAQQALQAAQERLQSAREAAAEIEQQSKETASQAQSMSGGWAIAAAATSVAGSVGAAALVADAEGDVASARAELARTPSTTAEDVMRAAHYPVIRLETLATQRATFRLFGFGAAVVDQAEALAQLSTEQVEAEPALGIVGSYADLPSLARLAPDLVAELAPVAGRLAARIWAAELETTWRAFLIRREGSSVELAAKSAAIYLLISETAPPRPDVVDRRATAIDFLKRSLP